MIIHHCSFTNQLGLPLRTCPRRVAKLLPATAFTAAWHPSYRQRGVPPNHPFFCWKLSFINYPAIGLPFMESPIFLIENSHIYHWWFFFLNPCRSRAKSFQPTKTPVEAGPRCICSLHICPAQEDHRLFVNLVLDDELHTTGFIKTVLKSISDIQQQRKIRQDGTISRNCWDPQRHMFLGQFLHISSFRIQWSFWPGWWELLLFGPLKVISGRRVWLCLWKGDPMGVDHQKEASDELAISPAIASRAAVMW